jgi:hypothetical protein
MYTLPRVALRPPVGVLRCTRGYTPSPLRGVKQGEGCQMNGKKSSRWSNARRSTREVNVRHPALVAQQLLRRSWR